MQIEADRIVDRDVGLLAGQRVDLLADKRIAVAAGLAVARAQDQLLRAGDLLAVADAADRRRGAQLDLRAQRVRGLDQVHRAVASCCC